MCNNFLTEYTRFARNSGYMSGVSRNLDRVKKSAEVFTPTAVVEDILNVFPPNVFIENQEFIDPACGDGQFLCEVVIKKLQLTTFSLEEILKQTFGVDIMPDNVDLCKRRLAGPKPNSFILQVLDRNIICANTLDPSHIGWQKVGYMWTEPKPYQSFFSFDDDAVS